MASATDISFSPSSNYCVDGILRLLTAVAVHKYFIFSAGQVHLAVYYEFLMSLILKLASVLGQFCTVFS